MARELVSKRPDNYPIRSEETLQKDLDEMYRTFYSGLPDPKTSETLAFVISAEIHDYPATALAKQILLHAAHDKGFHNIVIEMSEEVLEAEMECIENKKKPFLICSPSIDGLTARDNVEYLKEHTKADNYSQFFKLVHKLSYKIKAGDLPEDERQDYRKDWSLNPDDFTKGNVIDKRNERLAHTALDVGESYIIILGADHAEGVYKTLRAFDITPLNQHVMYDRQSKIDKAAQSGNIEAIKLKQKDVLMLGIAHEL